MTEDKRYNNVNRRIRKEWAIKMVKNNKKLTYNELTIKLMSSLNMSRRTSKEFLDMALYEVKDDRRI